MIPLSHDPAIPRPRYPPSGTVPLELVGLVGPADGFGDEGGAPAPPVLSQEIRQRQRLPLPTDFLAEDGGGGGPTFIPKPVSWADETDELEGDGTGWGIAGSWDSGVMG
uniref:Uncharacterized protein n=1 Tax=Amazona collaria TaxID=241587 RepID=A0A8B9FZE4_9PSIT